MIQGTADVAAANVQTKQKVANTVGFALSKFQDQTPEQQRDSLIGKIEDAANRPEDLEKLSEDEIEILNQMTAAHVAQIGSEKSIQDLANDVFDGLTPRLQRYEMGLKRHVAVESNAGSAMSEDRVTSIKASTAILDKMTSEDAGPGKDEAIARSNGVAAH